MSKLSQSKQPDGQKQQWDAHRRNVRGHMAKINPFKLPPKRVSKHKGKVGFKQKYFGSRIATRKLDEYSVAVATGRSQSLKHRMKFMSPMAKFAAAARESMDKKGAK